MSTIQNTCYLNFWIFKSKLIVPSTSTIGTFDLTDHEWTWVLFDFHQFFNLYIRVLYSMYSARISHYLNFWIFKSKLIVPRTFTIGHFDLTDRHPTWVLFDFHQFFNLYIRMLYSMYSARISHYLNFSIFKSKLIVPSTLTIGTFDLTDRHSNWTFFHFHQFFNLYIRVLYSLSTAQN